MWYLAQPLADVSEQSLRWIPFFSSFPPCFLSICNPWVITWCSNLSAIYDPPRGITGDWTASSEHSTRTQKYNDRNNCLAEISVHGYWGKVWNARDRVAYDGSMSFAYGKPLSTSFRRKSVTRCLVSGPGGSDSPELWFWRWAVVLFGLGLGEDCFVEFSPARAVGTKNGRHNT